MNKRINVTKSFLPPIEEYYDTIKTIWENHHLTNYGPLHQQLEEKLQEKLNVNNLHIVNNGTIALMVALESLGINGGEIITTPFTFIATSSSIMWQHFKPVFVDIDADTYNINPDLIEEKINDNTAAILAVHCFGYPCDVEKIELISKKYNIPVIYDAAHAFGGEYKGKSLLSYGNIACCSLHATKIYHMVEGGLVVANDEKYNDIIKAKKNYGTVDGNYEYVGINAKNSEFHSAMGLCVLNHYDEIVQKRKHIYELYYKLLKDFVVIHSIPKDLKYNYIYFPVLFSSENELLNVFNALQKENIYARRYFYPSLDELNMFNSDTECEVSRDISKRIACLPFDTYLEDEDVEKICQIVRKKIKK